MNGANHYTLDQLGDGLYAAVARAGGAAIGNAGLVDLGDCTLVVDTFLTPAAAEELRADAQRLTGRPPRWVVNTHYHNDHIWGNQVFLPEADILGTAQTRALILTAGKEEYGDYRAMTDNRLKELLAQQAAAQNDAQREALSFMLGYFEGLAQDLPRLHVVPPNVTFEKRMVLYGSRRRAELIEFIGAHSGSDTVLYLPDDGIVFMSDLLFVSFHPYIGDGNPDRWLEVLRSILDSSSSIDIASRFVPGHGATGTAEDLEVLVDYIEQSQQLAKALIAEGKTAPADVASAPIPKDFAHWALPRFFYANMRFLVDKYQSADPESVTARRVSNALGD